jgi:hypothetical protein
MSDPANILNATDMEQSRTPRELCDWVDAKAAEFSSTQEAKKYARSGARLPKKLWEEIRPLAHFARCRYGDNGVRCTPNLSNDNYDGRIDFAVPSTTSVYVEITYAKDGYDERLRLKVLSESGSVNALGKITVSGTKKSGQTICVENEAVDHTAVRDTALYLVKERLRGKSSKDYGKNHILVIVVDDYLPFRTDEDKAILMTRIRDELSTLRMNVGAVYVLGSSGTYCEQAAGEI